MTLWRRAQGELASFRANPRSATTALNQLVKDSIRVWGFGTEGIIRAQSFCYHYRNNYHDHDDDY